MNRSDWLSDDLLEDVFQHRATRGSLEGLRAHVLSATAAAGQRRGWGLRLANLLPAPMPRPALLALLLLAAILGTVLVIALAGRRPPSPFNVGTLAFVRDGDVYLANADGSDARVVLHENGTLFLSVTWSPDGSKLAVEGESGVVLLDAASGATVFVAGYEPAWSPDGRELAVIIQLQSPVLRIIESASGTVRAEFPVSVVGGLAWSPNGRWIAATGNCTGQLCPRGAASASNALIRIDVETGGVIQVDSRSGHLDAERQVAWSPDSQQVAYVRYAMDAGPRSGGDPLISVRDVIVADADGSNDTRVNEEHGRADEPSWSPDGHWIAFREGNHLTIEHPDGTAGRSVVDRQVLAFSWGPGSDRIWFTQVGPGGMAAVWEASLDGAVHSLGLSIDDGSQRFGGTGLGFDFQVRAAGQPGSSLPVGASISSVAPLDVVTPPPAAAADPSSTWSRLLTESLELCELLSIATDTGAATKIADLCNPQPTEGSSGSWSPTGAAYGVVRDGRLSIVLPDGRVDLDVGELAGLNGVAWSPDGTWLAATGTTTYLLRPDGAELHELPSGIFSWSVDGQGFAISKPDGTLLIGSAGGGRLSSIGTFPWPAMWSPDGSHFGFLRDGNLWTASIDGTEARNLTSLPLGGATGAAWSPDGRWIAVAAMHGLWLMRPDGADRRWLDVGTDQTTWGPVWSPNSSQLAFSAYAQTTASGQKARTYLLHADGSPTILIDDVWGPAWSPDGQFLLAAEDPDRRLVLMNADGSGRRVLREDGYGNTPVWMR